MRGVSGVLWGEGGRVGGCWGVVGGGGGERRKGGGVPGE